MGNPIETFKRLFRFHRGKNSASEPFEIRSTLGTRKRSSQYQHNSGSGFSSTKHIWETQLKHSNGSSGFIAEKNSASEPFETRSTLGTRKRSSQYRHNSCSGFFINKTHWETLMETFKSLFCSITK